MRKLFIILLAFLYLFGFGQTYTPIIKDKGKIVILNGKIVLSSNTLDQGLILKLRASQISEDSLTYNSSGDLVIWSNGDTVVFDGSSELVIGNSVRTGTPTSGTIYQVLDTLGSSDTAIFNQTFTGSVGDEYFWGGVGKWYDESDSLNHAIQTTAVYQPKLLWYGSDTAQVYFDGINDYMGFNNVDLLYGKTSIYINFKLLQYRIGVTYHLIGGISSGTKYIGFYSNSLIRIESNTNNDFWLNAATVNTNVFNKLVVSSGATTETYVNSVLRDSKSPMDNIIINKINNDLARSNSTFKEVRLYSRTLSNREIQILSE